MPSITYVHHKDVLARDFKSKRSQAGFRGLAHYLCQALEGAFDRLDYIAPAPNLPSIPAVTRMVFARIRGDKNFTWAEPSLSKNYGRHFSRKLKDSTTDYVLSTEFKHMAHIRCAQPIAVWQDACYVHMTEMYGWGRGLSALSMRQLRSLDETALANAALVAFPSDWAAEYAIEKYGVSESRVRVIPYGANMICTRTREDVDSLIAARDSRTCTLLFCGVEWERKGGPLAVEVAKRLNEAGQKARLIIVGCIPPNANQLPPYVEVAGFVDKSTEAGKAKADALFGKSHFLILFSQADTFGHVFCEACSFGVPCIASDVGGIPTAVRDGINGRVFSLDCAVEESCAYVAELMADPEQYAALAHSSFEEFEDRLNWNSAARRLREELESCSRARV